MNPSGIETLWHVCGVLLVVCLFILRRWVSSTNILLMCLFALPGVFLHELCHLIAGTVLGAHPTGFNLIPERRGNGWTLGSVSFRRVTALNAVPIAMAPLALLAGAYGVYHFRGALFPQMTLVNTTGMYGLLFVMVYESIPSFQDLRVACNWGSLLLYGTIVGGVLFWKWGYV